MFHVVLAFPSDASQNPAPFVTRDRSVDGNAFEINRTCSPARVTGVRSLIRAKPSLSGC